MKAYLYGFLALLLLPNLAFAQFSLQNTITGLITFLNNVLIPFLFGIAGLFFVINVIRYFVIQGDNEDGRSNAKSLALYSVFAFIFLIIFWGIINIMISAFGIGPANCTQTDNDYMTHKIGTAPPNCI